MVKASRKILVTRPKYEVTTHYLFHWAQVIVDLAKKKGIDVLDLREKRASRKEFESVAVKQRPIFVFINGHGSDEHILGQDNQIMLQAGKNEEVLESKIVYALSCKAARVLGPTSITAKAHVFIGYREDFIFWHDATKLHQPLEDRLAGLFLSPSNYLAESILKGHTAGESCRRSRNMFRRNIQKALCDGAYAYTAPYLLWDMQNQVCLGRYQATIDE